MTQPGERVVTDDLALLLEALPPRVVESLSSHGGYDDLLEVVLDLGRLPEARFPGRELVLSEEEITEADLQHVVERIGEFGADNRAGIERTLHRISCIRNRRGKIVGLTCRIGRAVYGTIRVIEDLVLSGRSILFLGRPGVGKTTMLREVARVLADDANKRVIIVDTSNEIAGDGDIPHPAIGTARRMQVPTPAEQHAVMIEAVENHMPEVIVIDEIGTELEATAARTIAERGVQLVGTAHGNSLENLMMNPTLSDLVGGIQSVTLGDDEARRRGTQKSILERKAPPTFSIIVEIRDWAAVTIHPDVAGTVDALLRGHAPQPEVREIDETGHITVLEQPPPLPGAEARGEPAESRIAPRQLEVVPGRATRILAFGLARNRLDVAAQAVGVPIEIVRTIDEADVVITLRNHYRVKPQAIRQAEERNLPIYVMRANTQHQMEQVLLQLAGGSRRDPLADMYRETEDAIASVRQNGAPIDLSPQNGYIRRLQHELASRYNLQSESAGRDPNRRVRILPEGGSGPRFPESL